MALPAKQQRFVDEFLLDLNATQAAIRAGYSAKTANEQGSRLLAKVSVQTAIEVATAQRSERTRVAQDRVIRELARIAFADIRDVCAWGPKRVAVRPSGRLPASASASVAEIGERRGGVYVKLHSKIEALKLLGQHLGMFRERTPLQELLDSLPPELAHRLYEALAQLLPPADLPDKPSAGGMGNADSAWN